MKILKFLVVVFIFSSCKQRSNQKECFKYLKELKYLKEYSENTKDTIYTIEKISDKIESIENFTGIKAINQGDWIGKHEVKSKDIRAWEDWFNKNCK
ncbi:protein of unknown function [Tenacibaculum sp. 190524A02b]|uniref:hypothetical protein n=1 Tax=Tenacibaculum vairaonense TaxID=3137860 RepID=UPI0032B2B7FD